MVAGPTDLDLTSSDREFLFSEETGTEELARKGAGKTVGGDEDGGCIKAEGSKGEEAISLSLVRS